MTDSEAFPTPSYDFSGRVALVTGGARGQGRSHARRFAAAGADVAVLDVCADDPHLDYGLADESDLQATVDTCRDHGVRARAEIADVGDEAAVDAAVERVLDDLGRIDVLVNNAGVWDVADLLDLDLATWERLLATNLTGAWLCAKHVGRHMCDRDGGGRIVNVGSTASLVATPGSGHYTATKHGLYGLTKALAVELGPAGVTVNLVCPSGVDTDIVAGTREARGDAPFDRIAEASGAMSVLPEQGLLAPAEVSEAVLWLASGGARNVTGQAIPVDRGMTVT